MLLPRTRRYNASCSSLDLTCRPSAIEVRVHGLEELRRTYIALKRPFELGLVNDPGIHIVYRDIRLCLHRGNQKQGDQRRGKH